MIKRVSALLLVFLSVGMLSAEDELIKFGDFEQWIERSYKESAIIGGNRKTLLEVGPTAHWPEGKAYSNTGGSPWGTSNVYAKVAGVVKTNSSVYKDTHEGHGFCAKLVTHVESVKVIGLTITSSKNGVANIDFGIPFTRRPRAIKYDYKVHLTDSPDRVRETGFSKASKVAGPDMCQAIVILQKREEDAKGNIVAYRVGTMIVHYGKSTSSWVNDKEYAIHYGDISHESWYRDYMGLCSDDKALYARNSKGKLVRCNEIGWAAASDAPTHAIVKFDSSHGGAYIGTAGSTLWIDNVRWVY